MSHREAWRVAVAARTGRTVASFLSSHYGPCLQVWVGARVVQVVVPQEEPTPQAVTRLVGLLEEGA